MYSVSPGKYRQRITIQEQVESQQSDGSVDVSWQTVSLDSSTDLSSVPAEVLMGAGREGVSAGTQTGQITARINFRWFAGLNQKMRIVWDGRNYDINSIEADATGRLEWRCMCTGGLTDGR